MEYFELTVPRTSQLKLTYLFRCVDDTFVVWPQGKNTFQEFLLFLSSIHQPAVPIGQWPNGKGHHVHEQQTEVTQHINTKK
jgi:hypothetical protein